MTVTVFTSKSLGAKAKADTERRSKQMSNESVAAILAHQTEHKPPPAGYEYHLPPGATEPQLRVVVAPPATEAAPEAAAEAPAPVLKGKLPEDFPGHASLEAAGLTTYAKVRKSIDTLEELEGIGPATAEKIREAVNAAPVEEEEGE